nr:MAG TPA: YafJ-type amidotransferase class-II [Caudoviricetes sp.]
MCIILSCAPNARPTDELLKTCWTNNPDGGGYMYAENGSVRISKGYMDFDSYLRAVRSVPANVPLVLHMRIGTSGGNGPEVTHPFPVTAKLEHLHALDLFCPVGIAHNGVLPYPSDDKRGISDTVAFIQQTVTPLSCRRDVRAGGGLARSSKARAALKVASKGSRLAVMDGGGRVRLTGDGWNGVTPGIQASNESWRELSPLAYWPVWDDDIESAYQALEYADPALADYMLDYGCDSCPNFKECLETWPLCFGSEDIPHDYQLFAD